ncbi:MAG: YugN family protein [Paenibacillaceae bacterium]
MIPINSSLEDKVQDYIHTKNELDKLQFSLGGNWDYDGGSFDRFLDEHRTVWLRIPFEVTHGEFDGEVTDIEARIQMGKPYVLRHLYQEGLDNDAQIQTYGGFIDQFQKPADMDAEIAPEWIEQSKIILKQVELLLQ